jgi:hypothetical protein
MVMPANPMKLPESRSATAQLLQPRAAISALQASIDLSLCSRVCNPGK